MRKDPKNCINCLYRDKKVYAKPCIDCEDIATKKGVDTPIWSKWKEAKKSNKTST